MKKGVLIMFLLGGLVVAALFAIVLYNGPRMKVQQHIRAFQAFLPPLPAGVEFAEIPRQLPLPNSSPAVADIRSVAHEREEGAVYYRYYCRFCHGERGDGNGAVGESYTPKPADLASPRVRGFSDAQLQTAMLRGTGHEPVLERVVPLRHRRSLVQFVRSLAAGPR